MSQQNEKQSQEGDVKEIKSSKRVIPPFFNFEVNAVAEDGNLSIKMVKAIPNDDFACDALTELFKRDKELITIFAFSVMNALFEMGGREKLMSLTETTVKMFEARGDKGKEQQSSEAKKD